MGFHLREIMFLFLFTGFSASVFVRAVWNDHRLLENRFSMHEDCLKHIWVPDLTFEKAKMIIDIGQQDIFFAVRDDHLYFTQRFVITKLFYFRVQKLLKNSLVLNFNCLITLH